MADGGLGRLLREHVAEPLRRAGFARAGRTFTARSAAGDVAAIDVQRAEETPEGTGFYVNVGATTTGWIAWLNHIGGGRAARGPLTGGDGLWRGRLDPPPEFGTGTSWFAGAGELDACGRALAATLDEVVAPALLSLLDRRELLALVSDQRPDFPLRGHHPHAPFARAAILVDCGWSDELAATVRDLEAEDPNDYPAAAEFAAWVRARAAGVKAS